MHTSIKAYKLMRTQNLGIAIKAKNFFARIFLLRIRLIPLVIFFATLVLTVRINSFFEELNQTGFFSAREALATDNTNSATGNNSDGALQHFDPFNMTPEQFRAIQGLARQRETLVARERAIPEKEQVLQALVVKIEEKIKELKKSQEELQKLVERIDEEENANIKRLVKMAEGMKPADAAKVLEGIEFPILLEIMEKMRERNASAILAAMEVEKAGYLMSALAKRRKIFKKGQPDKGVMRD